MPRPDGPHTRNPRPRNEYRGSRKRAARMSAFEDLPLQLWLVAAIWALMFVLTVMLLLRS